MKRVHRECVQKHPGQHQCHNNLAPEALVQAIIKYRLREDKQEKRWLAVEEIAEREECTAEDVWNVLSQTSVVWTQ